MTADILTRLQQATGPNYALDVEIFKAFNPEYADYVQGRGGLIHPQDGEDVRVLSNVRPPNYTASIDAAVALAESIVALEGRKLICFFCAGGQLTPHNADETSPDYHPKAKIDNSVTVGWMAHVRFYNADGTSKGADDYSHSKTAPLAILSALFRALTALQETDNDHR